MAAVLLAVSAAVVWGAGDFFGGKASQRAHPLAVTVVSQLASLPILCLALLVVPGSAPTLTDMAWGLAAGATGFLGIVLLYAGLSSGAMTVVAPITAVTAAALPLVVGIVIDASPGPVALLGAGVAVVAIALVSTSPRAQWGTVSRRLLGIALGSGAMFGLFFILLAQAGSGSGMWTLVAVRAGSLGLGLTIAGLTRTSLRLPAGALRWAVPAGMGDIAANAFYLAAAQHGPLSIVAPVAALYPATTVLLAIAVERERVRAVQVVGLGLAGCALIMIAA
jgi:drug/metabolite transporter (DMT)-like permease